MYDYKEKEQRKDSSQDEIDLRVVFNKLASFINSIQNGIQHLLLIAIKRILFLALVTLCGIGLGFFGWYVTKPYYTSSMTLVLADIRNEFVENQLVKLSELVKEDNFPAIAEELDISTDAAKSIKMMKFSNLDAARVEEDSVLTGSPFKVELSLYDTKLFTSMESAIANYLENNRYFSKLKRIKQREAESMIQKLKADISSIDSIKATVVSPRGPVNGFVFGEPIDPTNLYRESINMYQKQVTMEAELDKLDNIEVVNGFIPRVRPTGPNLLKYVFASGLAFFLLGLFIAVITESKRRKRLDLY